ncbi:hypothetical protein [Streptomyces hiroshimensis]|uniref:Uncharacterized protein n=1 Tax=Streptomyces hiroshimensis TaxID=66424 RepID=A0ABQ2YKT9_9ACTN|nr:hypothetical protein [Streptomyces hiroshimensis]GGX87042.1 hypothetical protein GCM10010324_35680 [Streptomyces hiroshimensis]
MMYDQERAQQPPARSRPPAEPRAPHTPPPEPARPPLGPVTDADGPGRVPGCGRLFPQDSRDKLTTRLQQAVSTFVDRPRLAVEEAGGAFDEAVACLTDALAERRRTLRANRQGQDTEAETEELRLALRQYREITERLLRM